MSASSEVDSFPYRVPLTTWRAELRERGSRFLAQVGPAASEEEARRLRAALEAEFPGATHVCWAFRLGWPPREGSSDAGEPRGTAGRPLLQVLRGRGLSDCLLVVARWFGGVKLGKGGLARAYASAAGGAVDAVATTPRRPTVGLRVEAPYDRLGAVKRLLSLPGVEVRSERCGREVEWELSVETHRLAALQEGLASAGARAALLATVPPPRGGSH